MADRHTIIAVLLVMCAPVAWQQQLPGTSSLTEGDQAAEMVEGINRFLARRTDESLQARTVFWKRNFRSPEDYERSISGNRDDFRKIIGVVDTRLPVPALELEATTRDSVLVSEAPKFKVFAVKWPVLDDLTGEGLLLEPKTAPVARIVAIPDADSSPEMLAGLAAGIEPGSQFARRLAESGCQVVVPVLIDRSDRWSGNPRIRLTNQPHREFIYRMAFELGRHPIGYEVQKILALVDWFSHQGASHQAPIGVIGYGEGGLLALYSAAVDQRIQAAVVSGYFDSRQEVWKEPIYRDVWGLLREFGDAEIASLIAPRRLIVEASRGPEVAGSPPETKERRGAAPNGSLTTPPLDSVQREIERTRAVFTSLHAENRLQMVVSGEGRGPAGSDAALDALLSSLGTKMAISRSTESLQDLRHSFDPNERLHRQLLQLVAHTQKLAQESPRRRAEFWSKADTSSPDRWRQSTKFHRDYFWDEVIGRLPPGSVPPNPRSRPIYDTPKFKGYEVKLDVWPDVFAYGILLVPKDIRPGERRPVVVCQHGLEGRPAYLADPNPSNESPVYHRFAARLAEEGFVTFAPQNPYILGDRFRIIQRKGHPLKLSLFSFILGQHQRILEWLAGLSFVDADRIGFYGLSGGGQTAVRVPPLLDRYALSICSAAFNEWVWKTTSIDMPAAYPLTGEYDMVEFNFGNVVNYSDLANLMAPRPFMVERGHNDNVAPDEWVAYEYAKVRRFYEFTLNLPGRTEIEFFNGGHVINGQGTFKFLQRHLRWPTGLP
jgi:dienelactone hydrolase